MSADCQLSGETSGFRIRWGFMIKKMLLGAILGMLVHVAPAHAQSCGPVPYALSNGTTADASQVMGNFNFLSNCQGQLRGYLGGLTMSNDAVSPNTVIATAAGVAASDDATMLMKLGAATTKNANAAWVAGGGSGCLDSGSALAASTWYHLFVIGNPVTGAVDELCSTSTASPGLPLGYTKKRRIGSFKTNSSSQIMRFTQDGDEFVWKSPVNIINSVNYNASGSRVELPVIAVPTVVRPQAIINIAMYNTSGGPSAVTLSNLDQDDVASDGRWDLANTGGYSANRMAIRVDSASKIYARISYSATTLFLNTLGWIDTRGK